MNQNKNNIQFIVFFIYLQFRASSVFHPFTYIGLT